MTDIFDSVTKWVKERTTSPLYGTFIFSVILWNWKFFYILFWQGEEKLLLPRIEYVQKTILDNQNIYQHFIYFLILPILSTYFIVWWLPILSNWAHKKHIDFYYKRRLILDEARLDYEKKEKKNLDSISVIKKEQAEVKKEIKKNTSTEDLWLIEFEDFKKTSFYIGLYSIIDSLYKYAGNISVYDTEHQFDPVLTFVIPENILAYAHTSNLVEIDGKLNKISLTEKGKFFVKNFSMDSNKPVNTDF